MNIDRLFWLIIYLEKRIMAAIDDLKTEVAALNASFTTELEAITAKLASLPAGTSDADVQAVVTDLKTLQASIDQETATLTGPKPAA